MYGLEGQFLMQFLFKTRTFLYQWKNEARPKLHINQFKMKNLLFPGLFLLINL